MAYNYQEEKATLFTEARQKDFLKMRDKAFDLLSTSGSVTMGSLLNGFMGSSWTNMAYVDRLVELGELREIQQVAGIAAQNRIFVRNR